MSGKILVVNSVIYISDIVRK